jgi:hypothetical protein
MRWEQDLPLVLALCLLVSIISGMKSSRECAIRGSGGASTSQRLSDAEHDLQLKKNELRLLK